MYEQSLNKYKLNLLKHFCFNWECPPVGNVLIWLKNFPTKCNWNYLRTNNCNIFPLITRIGNQTVISVNTFLWNETLEYLRLLPLHAILDWKIMNRTYSITFINIILIHEYSRTHEQNKESKTFFFFCKKCFLCMLTDVSSKHFFIMITVENVLYICPSAEWVNYSNRSQYHLLAPSIVK